MTLPMLESITAVAHAVSECVSCGLCKTRLHTVPGEGPAPAEFMFVGEAPGEVNNQLGRPFVGHGGKIFDKLLATCGMDRTSVFITNTVKCWPPDNRRPSKSELAKCRHFLARQIELVAPRCIVALGSVAFEAVTGRTIRMKEEHGQLVALPQCVVCPTFHPNGIRYIKGGMATIVADLQAALEFVHSLPVIVTGKGG